MRTIELNLYTFDELPDEAKDRARNWWRNTLDYPWFDEAIGSIKAFCDEFGVSVKDYQIGDQGSYIHTNATNDSFRGFTMKQAEQLKDKDLTGYCFDYSMTNEFYEVFKRSGDAKYAFQQALEQVLIDIRNDIEYQYSDEAVDDCLITNEYEFDQEGNRA